MKGIFHKIDNKKIAVLSVAAFILSMLPLWYLAGYARPSGDDYGYSIYTHAAWLDTHSIWEVLKAAVHTVRTAYIGWSGDFVTTFLFSLMPEVFVPWSYWIAPLIMSGALILGTSIFLYEVCVKIIGMAKEDFLIFDAIILLASFQYIPSTKIGMYWYVGAMHYIVPHMALLLSLVAAWRFFVTQKKYYLIAAVIWAFIVGGSSYFSCLLLFMLYLVLMVAGYQKNKKVLALIIPYLVCLICFIIQCKSPGNVNRGGADFGFHASAVVSAIFQALWQGIVMAGSYVKEKTFVFILLLLLGAFGWEALLKRKSSFSFRFPLLFVILMYGCYSSQFAPAIYAAVDVSMGPETMEYLTFLLAVSMSIFYVEGWLIGKLNLNEENAMQFALKWRSYVIFPSIFVCVVLTALNLNWLGNSVDRGALEYVLSGRADDFKEQMTSQMEILLDDSIKEAYLVPANHEQGPLMHMPVTEDEEAFTNRVVRDFYRKDRVVIRME